MEHLSEQEIFRRNSRHQLQQMGIDPYPAALYPTNAFSVDIRADFDDNLEPKRQVCVAGRIMSRRIMGKASFVELQDSKGRIQIYSRLLKETGLFFINKTTIRDFRFGQTPQ